MLISQYFIYQQTDFSFRALKFTAIIFIAIFAVFIETANAQTISGTIKDQQGAPVANAAIALLDQQTVVSQTIANDAGEFSLAANNQNNLRLRVTAATFAIFERELSTKVQAVLAIVLQPENLQASVTVSVTGNETRLAKTPQSVVVLNRETLNATAAQTVDDQLRQVPGFTLFRRASSKTTNPTAQGANLRGVSGSGASRAAILFDGVSLNDAFGGWTYWSRVPRAAVSQIEVLRGGASSVYGTAAVSGAVNIVPERVENDSDDRVLRIETSAGAQETFDASVFAGFAENGWSADFAGETFQTIGYFPTPLADRGLADARANSRHNNGFLTIGKRFNPNARVFARGNIFAERRDNGTNLQKNHTYFRQAVAGADFDNQIFGVFAARVFAESQIYDQTFSGVSVDRNVENLTRIQRVPSGNIGASLFWSRPFSDTHTVSAGFETRRVRGFSDETIINNNRATSIVGAGGREQIFAFSAQDFWRVTNKLNLNFGGRFDFWQNENALSATRTLTGNRLTTLTIFPDRSQKAFSPNVGALYQVNDNLAATASFNRSFRQPTLNELYRAFRVGNVLTTANENLVAERATNFETGARYSFLQNKFSLRGTVFTTAVSNPVVSVTLTNIPALITRQRQNLGETRSTGLELDFAANLRRDWQVSAGYLLVDARVREFSANTNLVDNFLPQIARQQLTFQTFYRPDEFSVGLQGRISDAQFDDDQNQFRLNPFFTLDAFTSVRLPKNVELFAAAENVFNNRFDVALTPNRTVAAPRFVRIGLRFNLGNGK